MASKIEHHCKRSAHQDTVLWAAGLDSQKDFLAKEKEKAHTKYIEEMNKSGRYYYGSPPRSRFLNWLGHKCLELAWGHNIYS